MTRRSQLVSGAWTRLLAWVPFFLVTGCGLERGSAELRIGLLIDRPSPITEAALDAARLAVATVNSAGGIEVDGRLHTVTMVVEETDNTPEGAIRASLELINREKVVAIVGSSISRNAIPSGEVAENAGIPMICPGSTHPKTTADRRYVFRVSFVNAYQARAMADFARQQLDLTTTAVLYDITNTYSHDIAAVFRQHFEASGGRVVAFESFTTGEQDFARQLERIRAAEPAALFLPNFSTEVILQARQARRLGIGAVLLGSDGWLQAGLAANRELEGAFFPLSWHRDMAAAIPEMKEFIARYRSADGHEPYESAGMTYDAFGLIFAAIATASSTEPESIRQALAQTQGYRGVTGPITYRNAGGNPHRNVAILQIRQGAIQFFKTVAVEPVQ